jgi:hypothetical protein
LEFNLRDWGRLEEAFELLKKKETLCLELGNRSGPAYCYRGIPLKSNGFGCGVIRPDPALGIPPQGASRSNRRVGERARFFGCLPMKGENRCSRIAQGRF